MFSNNNKISIRQFQILLIFDLLNVTVTLLPSRLAQIANNDSYILVFFGFLISLLSLFLITSVTSVFPNSSFSHYTGLILGKPISLLLTLLFAFKLILTTSLQLRLFGEILNSTILFNTPLWLIMLLLLLLCAYSASKGYEVRGRIGEMLIFFFLIPLFLVYIFTLRDTDFSNLKPILNTNNKMLFSGSVFALFSFSALELILLSYPYIKSPHRVRKSAFSAMLFAAVIILLIVLLTVARFGVADTASQQIPVIEIMDTIDFKGDFIERQNALVMTIWIISAFMIINGGLFFSALLLKDFVCLFSPAEKNNSLSSPDFPFVLLVFIFIYLVSFLPADIPNVITDYEKIDYVLSLFFLFILPIFLILVSKLRNVGGESK